MSMKKIWNILQLKHYLNTTEKFLNGHWNEYAQSSVEAMFYEQLEKY